MNHQLLYSDPSTASSLGSFVPRRAKSSRELETWLSIERSTLKPQNGRCLITLKAYSNETRYSRLVQSDTHHREVAWINQPVPPRNFASSQIPYYFQVMCLEWSWGLRPLSFDIDSPSNLLICKPPLPGANSLYLTLLFSDCQHGQIFRRE